MSNEIDSTYQSMIDSGMIIPETPATPVEEIVPPVETPEPPVIPPADIPIDTPPAITEPPVVNELEILNRTLGTAYTSLDEVNRLREDLASIPTLKEQATTPKVKFHSDSIAELNAFASATGIEDIAIFKDIKRYTNTESKDPIEAMVIAQIIEEPELADRKDMLRKQISMQYNTTIDEDADPTEEANRIEMVKFKMERDAVSANKTISTTLGKITEYKAQVEPDNSQAIQEAKAASQSAWQTVLADTKFTDQLNSIEVEVPLGKYDDETDLGTETVKYELSAEQKQSALANIKSLVESGIPFNNDTVNQVMEFERLKAIKENQPKMLEKGIKQALSKAKTAWEAKIHNPSTLKIQTPTPELSEDGKFDDLAEYTRRIMHTL